MLARAPKANGSSRPNGASNGNGSNNSGVESLLDQIWRLFQHEVNAERAIQHLVNVKIGASESSVLDALIDALEQFLGQSDEKLLQALTCATESGRELPWSFIGLLLRMEALQPRLVDLLLEKLSEYTNDLDSTVLKHNIPQLILREIRWIDHIVQAKELTEKLLGVLPAFPVEFQRDIIYILPDITSDEHSSVGSCICDGTEIIRSADHLLRLLLVGLLDKQEVVKYLLELIRSESSLVVCSVEALSHFHVEEDQKISVTNTLLERLPASPIQDLPIIVRYLVQNAVSDQASHVLMELRTKLSDVLMFREQSEHARRTDNEEALVLNALVQGFQFQPQLMTVYLACLKTLTESAQFRLLDVWIMVGVHSVTTFSAKIVNVFKKKVSMRLITSSLLLQAVKCHANALKSSFRSLLHLAGVLLRLKDTSTSRVGALLYQYVYDEFSTIAGDETSFYQGEIVSGLLAHCVSNDSTAIDAALDTLLALAGSPVTCSSVSSSEEEDSQTRNASISDIITKQNRLRIFSPIMKQLLDFIQTYNTEQARKVYNLLFAIGGHQDTDLCNILRKQVAHQELRYRLLGIIGSVARLKRLVMHFEAKRQIANGCADDNNTETESSNVDDYVQDSYSVADSTVDKARSPIQSSSSSTTAVASRFFCDSLRGLYDVISGDPKCLRFLMDELSVVLEEIPLNEHSKLLIDIVSDYFTDFLTSQFFDDYDATKQSMGLYKKSVMNSSMNTELWFGLDNARSPVYLRVLDLVASTDIAAQESLVLLCPLVTLLLTCASRLDNITEIECVLVCPMLLMERSVLEDLAGMSHSVQEAICLTLWYAINWIRSILTFFCSNEKQYYVCNVLQRLEQLLQLEAFLQEVLCVCGTFVPPDAQAIGDDKTAFEYGRKAVVAGGAASSKATGKVSSRPTIRSDKSVAAVNDQERWRAIRKTFVRLGPQVVTMLTFELASRSGTSQASQASAASNQSISMQLSPKAVYFLVELMHNHLADAAANETKRNSWLTSSRTSSTETPLVHATVLPISRTLLERFIGDSVLDAVCLKAHAYLEQLCEGISQDDTINANSSAIDTRLLVVSQYLQLIADVSSCPLNDPDNVFARKRSKLQALQSLLVLPESDRLDCHGITKPAYKEIMKRCLKCLLEYRHVATGHFRMAIQLVDALVGVYSFCVAYDTRQRVWRLEKVDFVPRSTFFQQSAQTISDLALTYLKRRWSGGGETSKTAAKPEYKNSELEMLLRIHLTHSAVILDSIQVVALEGLLELTDNGGISCESFPTLTKKSVGIYHRVMLETLVTLTARMNFEVGANDIELLLNFLWQAVLLFKLLVCLTKSFQKAMLVSSVLKHGKIFIDCILRAFPLFQLHFRDHHERILRLISEVQVATRRMQVLCAHGKLVKDHSVASQVPMVKKLLEKLIYKGEELAQANGVLDAYTTGVLKNRRIDGSTISKEDLMRDESNDEEEEKEQEEDTETDQE